jgi:hypothetical protein
MDYTPSVQTIATRIVTISNTTVKAWPGLRFTINIGGLDEFDHTTKVTARFFFESLNTSHSFQVRFIPEIVAVGPDPKTGLLSRNVTLYFGVSNLSTGNSMINDIDGTLGNVSIKDPIHTLQVRQLTNTSTHTHTHIHAHTYMCTQNYIHEVPNHGLMCML